MAEKQIAGFTIDVDGEGYLTNSDQWTKEIAVELAKEEGINELTDVHWKVIDFVRESTKEHGQSPTIRKITKSGAASTKELYALFPGGPGKKAAKIAGAPKPVGCV